MNKQDTKITIDFSEWRTQKQYAIETGYTLNTISQKVKRTKEGKTDNPLNIWDIPQLGITLVKK